MTLPKLESFVYYLLNDGRILYLDYLRNNLWAKTTWSYDEDGMTTNSTSGTIDRDHLDQFLKKHDARVMLDAKLGHLTHKMIYQAWKESVHAQLPHIG